MAKIAESFHGNLIIDFDSTFIQIEALDKLAEISLTNSPQRAEILSQIEHITRLGMEGQISFRQSLQQRLQLFTSKKSAVLQLISILQNSISASILPYQGWFQTHSSQIHIISGGFQDYILLVVQEFQIPSSHVLANQFVFDSNNQIIGFEPENPLSQPGGKVVAVQKLPLTNPVYIFGDGYTDCQIKESLPHFKFIAYTENISRDTVIAKADFQAHNWSEVLNYLQNSI